MNIGADLPEGASQFSVCQFFADGTHEYLERWVVAPYACDVAMRCARSVGARIGTTVMVIITDAGDDCVWQWEFGKGVTFPPEWVGVEV